MTDRQSRLIVSLLDRVSGPARQVSAAMNRLTESARQNAARMAAVRGQMFDAVGAGFALTQALSAPVKAAMEFESAMADVKKVVDFDTPASFKAFQNDILDMSTRIPMAAKSLSQIVAAAGQAGIDRSDLMAFTEMAAKVGVAFDISGGQAGDALAKLKTGLGLTVPQVGLLADAMNHLSNAMASSAPDILDVVRRVGAQAKQFGFNSVQVSAFASAMLSAGAQSDVAATSFRNMGKALTKGASATKSQKAAFAKLGFSSERVAKSMQKDAVGTTMKVLEAIGKLPKHMQAAVSSDLFGDEASALGPLLTNLPLLKQALGLVAKEAEYAGSANKEYAARAATFANSVQLMRNRAERLGIAIGTILIPPISDLMEMVTPLVEGVRKFAETFPNLTRNLIMATAAVVGLRVAAIGAQWAGLFMKGAVLQIGVAALTAAKGVGSLTKALLIAPIVRPLAAAFRGLRSAMIGFAATAAIVGRGGAIAIIGQSLLGLLRPISLVRGALGLLKVALISTGIGIALVGIGTAGAWIYKNWQGIGIAFEAFKGAYMREIKPVLDDPQLQAFLGWVRDLAKGFDSLTGEVDHGTMAQIGISLGKQLGEMTKGIVAWKNSVAEGIAWFTSLPERLYQTGASAIQGLWDGMVAKFNELLEWVKGIPARIVSAIGSIDLSNMIKWPSMPSWLGGGGQASAKPATETAKPTTEIEARAKGGPVIRNRPYLIGEEGPEIYTPGASGFISPNSIFGEQAAPSAAPAPSRTISIGDIIVSVGMMGNASAADVGDEIGRRVRMALESSFSDGIA